MNFFDVHTHSLKEKPDTNAIFNVFWQDIDKLPDYQPFSLSAHPWFLDAYSSVEFESMLKKLSDNPYFMAIGECGLDKNTAFNPDFQISILNEQYKFAKTYNKPMIIHCVRSFDQLIAWRKGKNVNMLVHGFNRKIELLKDLIKAGFYLSFGAAIFKDANALVNCPLEKLFFETDNQEKYSIEEIYNKAAEILNTDVELLKLQILENCKTFFKL